MNVCEWLINVVTIDWRKVTDTPEPKGASQVVSVYDGDTLPSCDWRKDRTYPRRVVQTELGKPDIAVSRHGTKDAAVDLGDLARWQAVSRSRRRLRRFAR